MTHARNTSDRRPIAVAVCAFAVAYLAIAVAAASAATLRVSVRSSVKRGSSYAITLRGTFKPKEVTGRAYLIAAVQYSAKPCASTAQAENRRKPDFYFARRKPRQPVGVFETASPFTETDRFEALVLGTRRVCAYLYPKRISASSATRPISREQALFRITKN